MVSLLCLLGDWSARGHQGTRLTFPNSLIVVAQNKTKTKSQASTIFCNELTCKIQVLISWHQISFNTVITSTSVTVTCRLHLSRRYQPRFDDIFNLLWRGENWVTFYFSFKMADSECVWYSYRKLLPLYLD